jgi:hypothetical protein
MPPGAMHRHTSPNPPVPIGSTSLYPGIGSPSGSRSQFMVNVNLVVQRPKARAKSAGASHAAPIQASPIPLEPNPFGGEMRRYERTGNCLEEP